jgi:amidase
MLTTRDPLNAFLDLPEVSVPHAESGPLAGLTLAVKDIFDVAGYVTGCGNPRKAAEAKPAKRTASAVKMILDAGARFLGKTQTEELAFSMIGQNVHFPHPVNPRAPDRITGGSSSGSVASVAGGLADIAIGSDTGGSIRAPASFCGLVGLRTTHGRIPLDGAMPLAPSLDTFGWFAKDIDTYEAVAKVVLAPDKHRGELTRPLRAASLDALLLGPAEAAEYKRMSGLVAAVTGAAKAIRPVQASTDELYWCLRKIQAKEAWGLHGRWISAGNRELSPLVEGRFRFGATVSLPEALAEGARRKTFRAELRQLLGNDGFLVLPTVPGAAPRSDSTPEQFADFREIAVRLFSWSGLSGFPQVTLPLGQVDGAPFGISLLGPPDSDLALLRLARSILTSAGRA